MFWQLVERAVHGAVPAPLGEKSGAIVPTRPSLAHIPLLNLHPIDVDPSKFSFLKSFLHRLLIIKDSPAKQMLNTPTLFGSRPVLRSGFLRFRWKHEFLWAFVQGQRR